MQHEILMRLHGNAPVQSPLEQGKGVTEGIRQKYLLSIQQEKGLRAPVPVDTTGPHQTYMEIRDGGFRYYRELNVKTTQQPGEIPDIGLDAYDEGTGPEQDSRPGKAIYEYIIR